MCGRRACSGGAEHARDVPLPPLLDRLCRLHCRVAAALESFGLHSRSSHRRLLFRRLLDGLGPPLRLRRRGPYFGLTTLVAVLIMMNLIVAVAGVTGGEIGLTAHDVLSVNADTN